MGFLDFKAWMWDLISHWNSGLGSTLPPARHYYGSSPNMLFFGGFGECNNKILKRCTRSPVQTFAHSVSDILYWTGLASSDTRGKAKLLLNDESRRSSPVDQGGSIVNERNSQEDDIEGE